MKKVILCIMVCCIICIGNFTNVIAQPLNSFSNFDTNEENITFISGEEQLDIKTLENLEEIKKLSVTDTIKVYKANKEIEKKQKERTINPSFAATDSELDMLAKIIFAEARGESYDGKVAVGAVILNRVRSSRYPNTIKQVIFAPGQFSPIRDGSYAAARPTEAEYKAANDALAGVDPTHGALTFYAYKYTKSSYHESLTHTATIGNHKFFK